MQPIRHRYVCTAANAFVPSKVLTQLFAPSFCVASRQKFSSSSAAQSEAPSSPTHNQNVLVKRVHGRILDANRRQRSDIHPFDLSATLEAHRDSNRKSIIRGHVPTNREAQRGGEHVSRNSTSHKTELDSEIEIPDNIGNSGRKDAPNPLLRGDGSKQKLSNKARRRVNAQAKNPGRFSNHQPLRLEYEGQTVYPIVDTIVPEQYLPWASTSIEDGYERLVDNATSSQIFFY
jgi:hypothetical protein